MQILEEYHSDDGSLSVFRLRDEGVPGCVEIWKIERHQEGVGWFCVAIDLSYLRQDLQGQSPANYLRHHHRSVAQSLERQFAEQSQFIATHYWINGFIQQYTGRDRKGRPYQSRRIESLRLIAGDYQGAAGVFVGQRYIERIDRKIVDQIANDRFREFHAYPTWKAAVQAIDWVQWHEGILRSNKGIAPDYHLQVPKPFVRRKG